jgi:hypothetical protein
MAYFANGSEGMVFDAQCSECKYGQEPCPIAIAQCMFNYKQVGNKLAEEIMNTLVDKKGICQMKKVMDEMPNEKEENVNQINMWEKDVAELNKENK